MVKRCGQHSPEQWHALIQSLLFKKMLLFIVIILIASVTHGSIFDKLKPNRRIQPVCWTVPCAAGIQNKPKTWCYMNAVVQSLYHYTPFQKRIASFRSIDGTGTVVSELQSLFKQMSESSKPVCTFILIDNLIILGNAQFASSMKQSDWTITGHQDAHEFLMKLLSELEVCVCFQKQNSYLKKTQSMKDFISRTFMGIEETRLENSKGYVSSIKQQLYCSFRYISLIRSFGCARIIIHESNGRVAIPNEA
jgi:hypothetical protein